MKRLHFEELSNASSPVFETFQRLSAWKYAHLWLQTDDLKRKLNLLLLLGVPTWNILLEKQG
jgi:hypothetical protein